MAGNVDLNRLAVLIALEEGKRVQLPIGQVKEVMRILFRHMATMPADEVAALLKRFRSRGRKA